MVRKKNLLFFLLIMVVVSAPFVGAEIITTVTITDYILFLRLIDDDDMIDPDDEDMLGVTNLLNSRLDIKSRGNKQVKAQFQLDAAITGDQAVVEIPRAYIKARFPGFRITLGKTRVSWGEGFMFNAGDVIFGGMSLDVDISQAILRDETDIFTVVYIPLGRFSYIEGVFLPLSQLNTSIPGFTLPIPLDIKDTSVGARISGKLKGMTFEAGYLYEGQAELHKPYIAMHGSLLIDWYAASSLAIPQGEPEEMTTGDAVKESFALSCGFFDIIKLEGDASLNLRLESGISPFGEWEEWDAEEELVPLTSPYGIYIFPEIVYSPSQSMSFQLRSLISPLDLSGIVIAGMNWNMYQGFTLGFTATAMFGDGDDLFGWERDGDTAFIISLEYIFGE